MPDAMPMTDQAPAMPVPPLPGRADFPGAYQQSSGGPLIAPSGDIQSFAEPQPVSGPGMKAQDLKAANDAVAAAMQFQGHRSFMADVANGVPFEKALWKNADKIFFHSPSSFNAAVKMSMAHNVPPFEPSTRTLPDGTRLIGIGPNRWQADPMQAREQASANALTKEKRTATRKQIQDSLKVAHSELPGPTSPLYKAKKAEIDDLEKKLDSLWEQPGSSSKYTIIPWDHEAGDFKKP